MAVVISTLHGWLIDHRDSSRFEFRQSDMSLGPTEEVVKAKFIPACIRMHIIQNQSSPLVTNTSNHIGGQFSSQNVSTSIHVSEQTVKNSYKKYQQWILRNDLFSITSPFQMDSQFSAKSKSENQGASIRQKRKRRRQVPLNEGEELAAKFHSQVQDLILQAYECIMEASQPTDYFMSPSSSTLSNNNTIAREAAMAHSNDLFADHCWKVKYSDSSSDVYLFNPCGVGQKAVSDVCNKICRNNLNTALLLNVESQKYIVPANSTFIMSDVLVFKKVFIGLGKFDLIVMDPPWQNKSVKRKKTYYALDNEELLDLPLECLMNPGCLVAVWVTNRCKHIDFIKNQLFPGNNIKYMASWFWLKVTKTGQMVYDIHSEHRKPYETLIIGKYTSSEETCQNDASIKENRVFISVPCSLHSKKPPLLEILRVYLSAEPHCLEMFARNLMSNWTSWGNESSCDIMYTIKGITTSEQRAEKKEPKKQWPSLLISGLWSDTAAQAALVSRFHHYYLDGVMLRNQSNVVETGILPVGADDDKNTLSSGYHLSTVSGTFTSTYRFL